MANDVAVVVEKLFPAVLGKQVAKGEKKYGVRLHTWNGRDAAQDVREELVDGFQYLTQLTMERDEYVRALTFFAEKYGFWLEIPLEMRKNMELVHGKECKVD